MSCSEWKKVKLGDLIDSISIKHKFDKDEIIFLNTSDVLEGKVLHNNYSPIDGLPGQAKKSIKKDDILFSEIRPKNKRFAYIDFDADNYVVSTKLMVLRRKSEDVNNKYLYNYLTSPSTLDYLQTIAEGRSGTFPQITFSELKSMEINLPPLEEQEKIANILSSLDDKIELNNEMNKTLEEMAQSIFKRWFVDFEFPNEDGQPYKSSGGEMVESELGMIPKGWEYGVINDTCEKIYSGGTPKTSEETYWNGELNWMSSGETRNNFIIDTEKYITQQGADKSSTKLANRLNTVIASAGQGFTRGQTSLLLIDTYINQSLITLKPKYYYEFFNYFNIKRRYDELRNISDSHSIRGSLTTKMICKLGTILPSIEVLKEFCVIIEPIIIQIENNIRNSQNIEELRNQLLPKLMNGEIKF